MKKAFFAVFAACCAIVAPAADAALGQPAGNGEKSARAKSLKVLTIGNSFTLCLGTFLPRVVNSVPGCRLELTSAYIGGCSLERHVQNLAAAERDPGFSPYRITVWSSDAVAPLRDDRGNVNTLLADNQYDIITIQQASPKSFDYATYQPFADELIAYVRKYQPQAEIVIQQTWSYRSDHPNLLPNPGACWDFDQAGMYERLRDAYRKLAERYRLRVIPAGDAVQKYRRYTPVKYRPATENPEYPALPSSAGDVVGSASWKTNSKTGERTLYCGKIHLNTLGKYLQACLWFSFLYGEPVDAIGFVPEGIGESDIALVRRCAQEALDEYIQQK